jgi:hypothetical protein
MMNLEEFYAALSKDDGWHLDGAGRLRDRHYCCPIEAVGGHPKKYKQEGEFPRFALDECIDTTVGPALGGTVITAADNPSGWIESVERDDPTLWAVIARVRKRMLQAVGLEEA